MEKPRTANGRRNRGPRSESMGKAPAEVVAAYRDVQARYDALYAQLGAAIAAHNARVDAHNELVLRRDALAC